MLAICLLLNLVLFASNYFTGEGITDAVLYTLTNSLTGAGVGKYVLPGIAIIVALMAVFALLAWIMRRRRRAYHTGYSLLALCLALASVGVSPASQQLTRLLKSQALTGESDFANWYKAPHTTIAKPKLNLVYIYAESLKRTYFNDTAFPQLTPDLGPLMKSGLDFS